HLKDKLPAELIRAGMVKVADDNLSIGEKIKLVRIASGLSLEQFARKIGVRRSTVYNWENAKRNIRESTKKVIKVYFGYILDKLGISLD
ncbi:MAG TPA: XRE family transcriptional regulator, partial [Candidatus Woesearchaeota archaeon]|nr:XRE family transcriptional regulator [Candidatus Woesearchaeota archaeon]